jgi:hypothetical protein
MCTFVATGQRPVKQLVATFVLCARAREAQIKTVAELAAMKKNSIARGGMDNSGPFQHPSVSGIAQSFGRTCFAAFLLALNICQAPLPRIL